MKEPQNDYPGHTGPISAMAFSPDGARLASISSGDMTLRVWDVASGKLVQALLVGTERSYLDKVGFSSDGSIVYVFGFGTSLKAWTIESGEPEEAPSTFEGWDVGFSDCGRRIATVSLHDPAFEVRVFDMESRTSTKINVEENTWPEYGEIQRFSKDLSVFAADTLDPNGAGSIYDANTGEILYSWEDSFGFLAELPSGPAVVNARLVSDDEEDGRYLEVVDPFTGELLFRAEGVWPEHNDQRYRHGVGIPGTHRLIYPCRGEDAAFMIDLLRPDLRIRIQRGISISESLAADREGRYLAVGEESGQIRIVDAASGELLRIMGGVLPIGSLAISPDCRYLVVAPPVEWNDFTEIEIRLWDLVEGRLLLTERMTPQRHVQLTLRNRTLTYDHRLGRLVESGSQEEQRLMRARTIIEPGTRFTAQRTSHNGRWLVVLNVETISVFDVESGEVIGQVPHELYVQPYISIAISEGGERAAAGIDMISNGVTFDVPQGKIRPINSDTNRPSVLALSTDGLILAVGDSAENQLHVLSIKGGPALAVLSGHSQEITCISFTSDGKHLISAGKDGQIIFWDAATFDRKATLINLPIPAN